MTNLLYNSFNGNIIYKFSNINNTKEYYRNRLVPNGGSININVEVDDNDKIKDMIMFCNDIRFPGAENYNYNNSYNTKCLSCTFGEQDGCCKSLILTDDIDISKYYISNNAPVKKPIANIELFALDQLSEFDVNPDYEEITVDTSDNPKIYAKVSFSAEDRTPMVFANKFMRCRISRGACKVINKTDETGVAWVELNINGQIGNNETFTVSSIDDGNTEEYTPFIGSTLNFTMLA